MTESQNIKANVNYICYNQHINSACYDLREYYKFVLKSLPEEIKLCTIIANVLNNSIILSDGDAYANIKIYNATYANLYLKTHVNDVMIIPLERCLDCFTFPDININNPLFSNMISFYEIQTDGTKCFYNKISFSREITNTIRDINNSFTITWFYSRNVALFLNNKLTNSFFAQIDNIVVIPKPLDYEINDERPSKKQKTIS